MAPPARKARTTKAKRRKPAQAECNVPNRTIFSHDNLEVMQGINDACIDLIYLDPPFNKKKVFTAPIGSHAEGADFKDIFYKKEVKLEWLETIKERDIEEFNQLYHYLHGLEQAGNPYNFGYLAYMAIRLIQCERILKQTGSIYLHCDPTMSHYLKILMDCIFGEKNFRNELIWYYKNASRGKRKMANAHDVIFWYGKSDAHTFNREDVLMPYESGMTEWRHKKAGKPVPKGKTPDDVLVLPSLNTMDKERLGYPTQKPLALLTRIIKASSNEDEIVLDPFCGCATTCIAAAKLGRQWIGIDVSTKAYDLIKHRYEQEIDKDQQDLVRGQIPIHQEVCPPVRTDGGNLDPQDKRYVYVVSHPDKERLKVGIAKNVKKRVAQFHTSDPDREHKLEFAYLTPHYREIERFIHNKYPNHYEWVTGDLKAIIRDIKRWKPELEADR